jgi:hypothetical protein
MGGHHLIDSSITDDGTTVTINTNTVITGSLQVTQGITGSFSGSGFITSASYALSSSFADNANNSVSSSYALSYV